MARDSCDQCSLVRDGNDVVRDTSNAENPSLSNQFGPTNDSSPNCYNIISDGRMILGNEGSKKCVSVKFHN